MPTAYNSEKTKRVAQDIAHSLGISYGIAPIGELVSLNEQLVNGVNPSNHPLSLSDAAMENVQAKIRGTSVLSNLSAKLGALFTNNGNKLEVALGYATLYGDWGGSIAPIGDLNKTEVVAMAEYINREVYGRKVIPQVLIPDRLWVFGKDQIEPSAELKHKQVDPMKFVYHDALLDAMTDYKKMSSTDLLRAYHEGTLHTIIDKYLHGIRDSEPIGYDIMERWGITNPKKFVEDLEWFERKITGNVFKRVQAPPIIITSKSAYGYDIRESMLPYTQSSSYVKLKEAVCALGEYTPREQ